MRIGIILLATGKYLGLVPAFIASAKARLLASHERTFFVLTDAPEWPDWMPADARLLPVKHYAWPEIMHRRYETVWEHAKEYIGFDYLIHMDVDLRIDQPVGEEILSHLTATISPVGYDWPDERKIFCRNPLSQAHVPMEYHGDYHTGSLILGRTINMLDLISWCKDAASIDESNGCMGLEELYLNKYLMLHPPALTLSPEYCCPERSTLFPDYKRRIIITLDKVELDKDKPNAK